MRQETVSYRVFSALAILEKLLFLKVSFLGRSVPATVATLVTKPGNRITLTNHNSALRQQLVI